ncbi:MAG: DNA/RNA nuclease SfsA [Deltaproteobacteria bacterium]|nr:DNA/RNA nuclease SfsA [Deltaproteobacteria bacterium]
MIQLPLNRDNVIQAVFLERPNRFLVRCITDERGVLDAYLPNPGRLWELLLPGASLYLYPTMDPEGAFPSQRKTRFTVMAVQREESPIFLHTHITNQVARTLIERGEIPSLEHAQVVRGEVTRGRSRFDLLLEQDGKDLYLEVKSCTLFGNGVAMFPDAVTQRGRRHLLELAEMANAGIRSAVLFIVHSPKVTWFMPDFHTDYDFSTAFLKARDRVMILPIAIEWTPDLTLGPEVKSLEVPWDYLRAEMRDRGSYLLILKIDRTMALEIGRLGTHTFSKGYYVYVGSAMRNLRTRVKRHLQRRKKLHWHIDYLTAHTGEMIPLPIRSSRRDECEIAKALLSIMQMGPSGFGSSDCPCQTHLFFSDTNPLHIRAFHDVLKGFRMTHP